MSEEKTVKGIVEEEVLDEITGGLDIDKSKLKKVLAIAGVTLVAAGGLRAGIAALHGSSRSNPGELPHYDGRIFFRWFNPPEYNVVY